MRFPHWLVTGFGLVLMLHAANADAMPTISIADTSTFEGNSGVHPMVFRIQLSEPVVGQASFHYATFDGTAMVSDGDYQAVSNDAVLGDGVTQTFIQVPIQGDTLLEGNERFTVVLSNLSNLVAGDTVAVGTILNDERTTFVRFSTGIPDFSPGTLPPDWGDANGDGLPDLPMYLNIGGTFVEMPGFRDLLGDGNYHGGAWCDYDRDGDMDLVLMPYGDDESAYNYTRLLENRPSGFIDVGPLVGVDISGHGETPVWADFDANGWPDLFLPFYSHEFPFRSFFFLNEGAGRFRECADSAGVSLPGLPPELRPEGATAADWNGDGAIDLYCASHLFLNDGNAHFTDVAAQVGLPVQFDEGAQFVDYDNDGDLDLYLRTANGPTLYRNDNGIFVDVTASLGVGYVDWLWGDRWVDVDLDGDLDLIFFDPAVGPRLLLSNGDGTFTEDSTFRSLNLTGSLCSFADIDGDGDPDLVVGDYTKQFVRNLLEQVPRTRTPYVKVRVEDSDGYLVEQGSTVRLRSLDDPLHPIQTRVVDGGSGYLGQDEYTITFGGVGSGTYDLSVSFPGKPGSPVVVGPAENPLLHAIHPGDGPPQLIVVRPNHQVFVQDIPQPNTGVRTGLAAGATLTAPRPNPARTSTELDFTPATAGPVSLTIYDVTGRRVRMLMNRMRASGPTHVVWDLRDDDGRAVHAGLYFARLEQSGRVEGAERVVVLR